ncbi:hypothetical protein [Acuticoccus sediminis]|uniref:hypothetical protein n=1 Tax=Acuticoccus sediminis TaxID=2184697 RepID=UPI0011B93CDB|nr:hypothetical protein [Acuticoccus sediminis]
MGWLGRARLKRRHDSEMNRLVHPLPTLLLGISSCTVSVVVTIPAIALSNQHLSWWVYVFLKGLFYLSFYFLSAYFIDKHTVSSEGLQYSTIIGRQKEILWIDVQFIQYNFLMKWFQIRSRSRQVARLSAILMGLPQFAQVALEHVPNDALDRVTEDILEETARGNPPSVWD